MNPVPPATTPPANSPSPAPAGEGSLGPIIGTIIILAVIVLGGLYFWGQRSDKAPLPAEDNTAQVEVESIIDQSSSDETAAIEADLESTDIDNLDAELDAI